MEDIKEISKKLKESESSIDEQNDYAVTKIFEDVLVAHNCKTCLNFINPITTTRPQSYNICAWLKNNMSALSIGNNGYNGEVFIKEDFIPTVYKECNGYIEK